MVTRLEIATRPELRDPRGEDTARKIRDWLGIPVAGVRTCDVYRVEADLRGDEAERVLAELVDPVSQVGALGRLDAAAFDVAVEVGYKPGVTDPVGKSARVAIEDTLARALAEGAAVYSSRVYLLRGVDRAAAERIALGLLANPVIERAVVRTREEWLSAPPDLDVPRVVEHATPPVATVDLSGEDAELERLSRKGLLALDLAEMRAIRDHFRSSEHADERRRVGLGPHPTDVELECLAQTWSEHCKHKIFNAAIRYTEPGASPLAIRSLFKTYIAETTREIGSPWLVSVFEDNAGVVAFDDVMHLVYKVETHNSPSALDPYGGAITGIVGVNRDPFGTGIGADLLANVWGYCFADPSWAGELPRGLLHPRRIRDGVHQGVIDGGNQSGIPYGRGFERFDARFLGKPLVFCGTVGALPVRVAGRPGEQKRAAPGDLVVMTGGRIGADGIHGATFSSAALDESSPVQAVQIGDPITQRMMFDFLLEARDLGLYSAITDNGAGGLSSSVGEMARGPGGARIDLARAPLKYQGLAPWEILVSEAQERMTLAVPPESLARFLDLARRRAVEATVLGEFTDDGVFHVLHGERTVAHIPMEFLHGGAPRLVLEARWEAPRFAEPPSASRPPDADLGALALAMLSRLNVRSGEARARRYDHEVKGLTVIKPWIGVGGDVPADATVFLGRHGSLRGFVLSEGVNPYYSDIDTSAMAHAVVDEAVRRQLAAGARLDRIALLDNFCWPDPVRSAGTPDGEYKLAQLVRACRGLREACLAFGTPLVSGKDSMKNDSTMGGVKISVPPTLLVSAIGQIDDVRQAVTLEPREPGDLVFLVGTTRDELGGSEYLRHLGERDRVPTAPGAAQAYVGNAVPRLDLAAALRLYRAMDVARREGWVRSATVPALGGLAPALCRMVLASHLGLELDLAACPDLVALPPDSALFSESGGRFVVTVAPEHAESFARLFADLPCRLVGRVVAEPHLRVRSGAQPWLALDLASIARAFKGESTEIGTFFISAARGETKNVPVSAAAEMKNVPISAVRVLVVTGLGLNCEVETEVAFRMVGASPERVHLLDLLDGGGERRRLAEFDILAFVGGFAFGDHLGAGFVFANKIRYRLYDALLEFIEAGRLAIGICNGFQTMVRLGLLPGLDGDYRTPRATLAPNDRLGYRDAWVRVAFDPASPCVWTRGLGTIDLPSRHGEGKFLAESPELLGRLERQGQLVARYVDAEDRPTERWPDNPNGSPRGVAGICDPSGRLFGLMPHPDAYLYPFHHPRWRRGSHGFDPEGAGLAIFRNGVDAAAAAK